MLCSRKFVHYPSRLHYISLLATCGYSEDEIECASVTKIFKHKFFVFTCDTVLAYLLHIAPGKLAQKKYSVEQKN